jgi:hypothetical protein
MSDDKSLQSTQLWSSRRAQVCGSKLPINYDKLAMNIRALVGTIFAHWNPCTS